MLGICEDCDGYGWFDRRDGTGYMCSTCRGCGKLPIVGAEILTFFESRKNGSTWDYRVEKYSGEHELRFCAVEISPTGYRFRNFRTETEAIAHLQEMADAE
jgi:hypothetical protein